MSDLEVAGALIGFIGAGVVAVVVIVVRNSSWWHRRYHVERGVQKVVGCDRCTREDPFQQR